MDTLTDQIIEIARTAAKQPGWSKTRLATEAGLSMNALVNLFNEDFNPTSNTLKAIERLIDEMNILGLASE